MAAVIEAGAGDAAATKEVVVVRAGDTKVAAAAATAVTVADPLKDVEDTKAVVADAVMEVIAVGEGLTVVEAEVTTAVVDAVMAIAAVDAAVVEGTNHENREGTSLSSLSSSRLLS